MHSSAPGHDCLPAVQQLGLMDGDTWKKPLPLVAVSPPAPVQPGCACSTRPDVCPHPTDTGHLWTYKCLPVHAARPQALDGGLLHSEVGDGDPWHKCTGSPFLGPCPSGSQLGRPAVQAEGPSEDSSRLSASITDGWGQPGGQDRADKPLAPLRSALLPNPEPYGNDPSGAKNHRAR